MSLKLELLISAGNHFWHKFPLSQEVCHRRFRWVPGSVMFGVWELRSTFAVFVPWMHVASEDMTRVARFARICWLSITTLIHLFSWAIHTCSINSYQVYTLYTSLLMFLPLCVVPNSECCVFLIPKILSIFLDLRSRTVGVWQNSLYGWERDYARFAGAKVKPWKFWYILVEDDFRWFSQERNDYQSL